MVDASRQEPSYSIGELAERGGVSRRTVRYYVERGLLDAPVGAGRGAHYTAAHLERLVWVRQQQEAGVALQDIEERLARETAGVPGLAPPEPPPTVGRWTRVTVADGVEVHLRGPLPSEDALRAAVVALRGALAIPEVD